MLARLNHTRLLRYAGLFTWGAVGLWLLNVWLDPTLLAPDAEGPPTLQVLRWLSVYLTFGAVYWWITRQLGQRRPGVVDHGLLLVLTACAIGVGYFSGTGLGSILLMVVAGLLPWLMPVRFGLVWLICGNVAIIPVFVGALDFPPILAVLQSLAYMGFSSLVFVTALVARQQAEAREEQRRLNAELRATRALGSRMRSYSMVAMNWPIRSLSWRTRNRLKAALRSNSQKNVALFINASRVSRSATRPFGLGTRSLT